MATMEAIVINRLLENNKYDKEWIEQASWFILNNVATETFLANFNAEQLKTIRRAVGTPFVELVMNPAFNNSQMQVICSAIERNLPVEAINALAKPQIPYQSMDYMAQGFLEGLKFNEIEEYAQLTPMQCLVILEGFRSGVDYKMYADYRIPGPVMQLIKLALESNYIVNYDPKKKELKINTTIMDREEWADENYVR